MSDCLTDEALFAHVEGAPLTPEQQAHVASCETCRAFLEQVGQLQTLPEVNVDQGVATVMRRVKPAPSRQGPAWAAAAGLVLLVGLSVAAVNEHSGFTARGTKHPTLPWLQRLVSAEVRRADEPGHPLIAGARVARSTRWLAVIRNASATTDAFLLLFAVDSAGVVHWLYPAHLTELDDEPSLTIPRQTPERPTSDEVELDPAAGPATFYAVLSEAPLHVHDIEAVQAVDLATLTQRFPQAVIHTEQVTFE